MCIFTDGTAYIGEWKQDLFNGVGMYLTKDNDLIEGNFCGTPSSPFKM
jgi:hypothetical protein